MVEEPNHKDILGNKISAEATVVVPDGKRDLRVGVVKRLTPKMVTVQTVGKGYNTEKMVYPGDLLVVEDSRITMYLLKHSPS